jgi:glutamate-ammonia-ligase adenylyltransferase
MDGAEAVRQLKDLLSPSQARLLLAHWERLPRPEEGFTRIRRWLESHGAPPGDLPFLHLCYLAASSEALFLALSRRPRELPALSARVLRRDLGGREALDEALARHLLLHRDQTPEAALASFRNVETARIFLQDILGILDFEEVTAELAHLADVLVARAFTLTFQPLRESLGLPLKRPREGPPAPCSLAVFALGKLGGEELNYSSDVDLVAFYEEEGETDRGHPNGSFFAAWFQAAVALLTTPTPDGPCLRVDTALRPRGRDGELALSFGAALAYYREWADLWERQAWIKGRPCAGDLEAGKRFLRALEEVVYQPYAFAGIATQNARMREKAKAELLRQGKGAAERDVKEGVGGIRDAEFALQALQMAHGQKDPWVREGKTLLAAAKLQQKGVLSPSRRAELCSAYVLLRRAEHWVQAGTMRQTHRLPEGEAEWEALARYLGLPGGRRAREAVAEARRTLARLFAFTLEELAGGERAGDEVGRLLTSEGMREVLRGGGLPDPDRALPYLASLYDVLAPHLGSAVRRQHFLRIHYSLEREFQRVPDPHRGLVLLSRFVSSLGAEPQRVTLLLDRPRTPRLLFRIMSRSASLEEALNRWPFLVEDLTFEALEGVEREVHRLEGEADLGPDDLRREQKRLFFRVRAREILVGETAGWSQRIHSRIAEALCRHVFRQALRRAAAEEGVDPEEAAGRFALLGLGRLGSREMQPRSDLDLVCLKAGPWALPEDPERSARLERRLVAGLTEGFTAVTRHGALYDVDFRLRPYGDSGPVVVAPEALLEYFRGPARLWERLSYLKARPVAGGGGWADDLLRNLSKILWERGAPEEEVPELWEVLRRLGASARDLEGAAKFWEGGLWHADLLAGILRLRAGPSGGAEPLTPPLAEARAFHNRLLHRLRLHLAAPPPLSRRAEGFRRLGLLWRLSAASPGEEPVPEDLERAWEAAREKVRAAAAG